MIYSYKAVSIEGKVINGSYECDCESDLIKKLKEIGFYMIDCRLKRKNLLHLAISHVDNKSISVICKQLSVSLKSGVVLPEAILNCKNLCRNKLYKKSLNMLYYDVLNGENLSRSLSKNQNIYPPLIIKIIKIGEQNGSMDKILGELSLYYLKEYEMGNKIKTALTYPLMVFSITTIIIIILINFVVPQFMITLTSMNIKMPLITILLIDTCTFVNKYSLYINMGFLLIFLTLKYIGKQYKVKYFIDKIKVKIPVIGTLTNKFNEAKLTNLLYLMLSCGYDSLKALYDSTCVIDNLIIKEKIDYAIERIKGGMEISESMEQLQLFNSIFISLFKVGEKSGRLHECIYEAREIMNGDMDEIIKRSLVFLEPILIIVMSVIICIIVFSLLMPIINIMDFVDTKI